MDFEKTVVDLASVIDFVQRIGVRSVEVLEICVERFDNCLKGDVPKKVLTGII
jgi:hypothetical protein